MMYVVDKKVSTHEKVKCNSPLCCGNTATHYNATQNKFLCDKCAATLTEVLAVFELQQTV